MQAGKSSCRIGSEPFGIVVVEAMAWVSPSFYEQEGQEEYLKDMSRP